MLHCTMNTPPNRQTLLELEDLIGSLEHARRQPDLGRLAFIAYWDVRKWAHRTQRPALAELAAEAVTRRPHPDRDAFLALIDQVISHLRVAHRAL
jgi:hypothetical protein